MRTEIMQPFRMASFGLILTTIFYGAEQKYNVTIIDRENKESEYSYTVPSTLQANSSTNVSCSNASSCSSSTTTSTSGEPAHDVSYHLHGATLTLLLLDGRRAVVNCDAKTNWTLQPTGWYRSCKVPVVNHLEVEFNGSNAKLRWAISLDGKKTDSETYKIVAVVEGEKPSTDEGGSETKGGRRTPPPGPLELDDAAASIRGSINNAKFSSSLTLLLLHVESEPRTITSTDVYETGRFSNSGCEAKWIEKQTETVETESRKNSIDPPQTGSGTTVTTWEVNMPLAKVDMSRIAVTDGVPHKGLLEFVDQAKTKGAVLLTTKQQLVDYNAQISSQAAVAVIGDKLKTFAFLNLPLKAGNKMKMIKTIEQGGGSQRSELWAEYESLPVATSDEADNLAKAFANAASLCGANR